MYFLYALGAWFLRSCKEIGNCALFYFRSVKTLFTTQLKVRQLFIQMRSIGVDSSTIIFLSSISSGFALALQSYAGLSKIGGEEMLGVVVAWGMTRELGPVLTAIMVMGRSGSAIAAELGAMQITEQIDALRSLDIDPYQYLIVPRVLAGTIIMPFLTLFAMVCGILGGYLYTMNNLTMNPMVYINNIKAYLTINDVCSGLIKSSFFGFIIAFIGSYEGFYTKGGARGVGIATTKSVVLGCILILISNYFLSVGLFKAGL